MQDRGTGSLERYQRMPDLLLFTEAGTKKRASLRLVKGEDGLAAIDPGGLEVFATDLAGFACRLRESRHTLKRTLTDQRVFAGIGNAYSDEILLHAGLSPFKRARDMQDDEAERLFDACRQTLADWTGNPARQGRRPVSGEGHRVPRRDGSARQVPAGSRAPCAAPRSSASSTRRTRAITVPVVRPAGACLPIGRCRSS